MEPLRRSSRMARRWASMSSREAPLAAHALGARRALASGRAARTATTGPVATELVEGVFQVFHRVLDGGADFAPNALPVGLAGAAAGAIGVVLRLLSVAARHALGFVAQVVQTLLILNRHVRHLSLLPNKMK